MAIPPYKTVSGTISETVTSPTPETRLYRFDGVTAGTKISLLPDLAVGSSNFLGSADPSLRNQVFAESSVSIVAVYQLVTHDGTRADGTTAGDEEVLHSLSGFTSSGHDANVSVFELQDIINQQYPPGQFALPVTFDQAVVAGIKPGAERVFEGKGPQTGEPYKLTVTYTDTLIVEVSASRSPIANIHGQDVAPQSARYLLTTESPDGYRGQVWGGWLQTIDLDAQVGPVEPDNPTDPVDPTDPGPIPDPRIPTLETTPDEAQWTPDPGADPGFGISPNYEMNELGQWVIKGREAVNGTARWIKGETEEAFYEQVSETGWEVATDLFDRIGDRIGVPKLGEAVQNAYETYDLVKNFHSDLLDTVGDAIDGFGKAGEIALEDFERRINDISSKFLTDAAEQVDAPGAGALGRLNLMVRETNSFEVVMAEDGKAMVGGVGNDGIVGGAGQDIFIGGGGNDVIHGGGSVDTAIFRSLKLQNTVDRTGERATVTGSEGSDRLAGVEHLRFVDGFYDSNPGGLAAQVYRLYDSALDRGPEPSGLNGWVDALEAGIPLSTVAGAFADSAEFRAKYGNLDNTGFVTLLYNNVLGRSPEPEGLGFWTGRLEQGATPADVLLEFSESGEHVNLTRSGVDEGLWVRDDSAAAIARLYYATLDRAPDAAGLAGWRGAADGGTTLKQMAEQFMESPEFKGRYGTLDDPGFIRQLYRNVLDREGEPEGVESWLAGLRGGSTRGDVVLGFSNSGEHVLKMSPVIDDGIWVV